MIAEIALVVVALLSLVGTIVSARHARQAAVEAATKAAQATEEAAEAAAEATTKAASDAADAARAGSQPERMRVLGERYDRVIERMDQQDTTIESLRGEVHELRDRIREDTEVRHQLKTSILYLVGVIRQAIARLLEMCTEAEIQQMPQPLRDHLLGHIDFERYLDLAKARAQKQ